jgi:hypothetical protein
VGQDDRVPIGDGANSGRRLIRYGWLRLVLSQAQDKDPVAGGSVAKSSADPAHGSEDAPAGEHDDAPKPTTLLRYAETRLVHDLARIDSAPSPAPAHTSERETMRQVLSGYEFRNLQDPSQRDKFWERVSAMLNRILGSISRVVPHSVWVSRIVFWGFILAVCVGLVWGLLQLERRWRTGLILDSDGPAAGAASARDWQLWIQDARQAAEAGLWREAIHSLYWASISRLESLRLWPADRARTPREYLALVASEDPRKPGLTTMTGSFERFWYGGRSAAQSDYLNAEELATALITGQGSEAP